MHNTNEYVIVSTYADGVLPDGSLAIAKMTIEAHISIYNIIR